MRNALWLLPGALLAATLTVTGYAADESNKATSSQATTAAATKRKFPPKSPGRAEGDQPWQKRSFRPR